MSSAPLSVEPDFAGYIQSLSDAFGAPHGHGTADPVSAPVDELAKDETINKPRQEASEASQPANTKKRKLEEDEASQPPATGILPQNSLEVPGDPSGGGIAEDPRPEGGNGPVDAEMEDAAGDEDAEEGMSVQDCLDTIFGEEDPTTGLRECGLCRYASRHTHVLNLVSRY